MGSLFEYNCIYNYSTVTDRLLVSGHAVTYTGRVWPAGPIMGAWPARGRRETGRPVVCRDRWRRCAGGGGDPDPFLSQKLSQTCQTTARAKPLKTGVSSTKQGISGVERLFPDNLVSETVNLKVEGSNPSAHPNPDQSQQATGSGGLLFCRTTEPSGRLGPNRCRRIKLGSQAQRPPQRHCDKH